MRTPLAALGQTGEGPDYTRDFQIPYEAAAGPVCYFTRATFEPYVNGIFTTTGVGGRRLELRLVAVRDYSPAPGTQLTKKAPRRTDCFSLLFRASGPLRALTTIHTIEHAALGEFNLFLTESSVRGQSFCEAVINHLTAS